MDDIGCDYIHFKTQIIIKKLWSKWVLFNFIERRNKLR